MLEDGIQAKNHPDAGKARDRCKQRMSRAGRIAKPKTVPPIMPGFYARHPAGAGAPNGAYFGISEISLDG
jgi:hypothetical protein